MGLQLARHARDVAYARGSVCEAGYRAASLVAQREGLSRACWRCCAAHAAAVITLPSSSISAPSGCSKERLWWKRDARPLSYRRCQQWPRKELFRLRKPGHWRCCRFRGCEHVFCWFDIAFCDESVWSMDACNSIAAFVQQPGALDAGSSRLLDCLHPGRCVRRCRPLSCTQMAHGTSSARLVSTLRPRFTARGPMCRLFRHVILRWERIGAATVATLGCANVAFTRSREVMKIPSFTSTPAEIFTSFGMCIRRPPSRRPVSTRQLADTGIHRMVL